MKRTASRGVVIDKGSPDFDAALLGTSFNAQDLGRRPDRIVQANDVEEVIAAVERARDEGLTIGICSGGHSWAQNHIRDGGMLLDLSRLNSIAINGADGTAIIGPGCLAGELNAALVKHKLFFPVAHAHTVGMGGFLLQGGFGWNSRTSGLACQSVIGIDVVLADGTSVHASEQENPELLWAARGAGPGFFGVVVRFHLKLHRRPKFVGLKLQIFRMRHLEEVMAWADKAGPDVSPSVEFQLVFNRRATGIFAHGIEVLAPVLTNRWFGWHGDAAAKYKLWHPQAHVHVGWRKTPPAGTSGRALYVGQTSIVDEYIGSDLIRGAIRFVPPATFGFTDKSLDDDQQATIICARIGLGDAPIDIGYLAHHVRAVPGGSEMRSRFWMGGRHIGGRNLIGSMAAVAAKRVLRLTESDARALLVHCAQEMPHLASFLPELSSAFKGER